MIEKKEAEYLNNIFPEPQKRDPRLLNPPSNNRIDDLGESKPESRKDPRLLRTSQGNTFLLAPSSKHQTPAK